MDVIEAQWQGESKRVPLLNVGRETPMTFEPERKLIHLEKFWKKSDLGGLNEEGAAFEYQDHEGKSPADYPECAEHYPVARDKAKMGWIDPATHDIVWAFEEGEAPDCLNLNGVTKVQLVKQ